MTMRRAIVPLTQELIRYLLHMPDDAFVYSAEYNPNTCSVTLYVYGMGEVVPEGFVPKQMGLPVIHKEEYDYYGDMYYDDYIEKDCGA